MMTFADIPGGGETTAGTPPRNAPATPDSHTKANG